MELNTLQNDLPALLEQMASNYNPAALEEAMSIRPTALTARSLQVATKLGGFITQVQTILFPDRAPSKMASSTR
jgi:hypothetical protein